MKAYRPFLLATVVLVGVMLVLAGCGKKENPYSPTSDYAQGTVGANIIPTAAVIVTPAVGGTITDLDGSIANTQGQIVINFGLDMNPSTVTLANIVVASINGTVSNPTIVFYPEIKRVVISATFTDNYWYTITFGPGLRSKAGKPIDGNGNGQFDGTPYDDHIVYMQAGVAPGVDTPDPNHPKITGWTLTGGGLLSGTIGLSLTFNAGDFDTVTVNDNFTLRDSVGNIIPIGYTGVVGNTMYWTGVAAADTLRYDTKYVVTVTVNNIRDRKANKATWSDYGYIATVPDLVYYFRTVYAGTGDHTPLHFTGATGAAGSEVVVTFDDSLDYTTINATNIKLYKWNGSKIIGAFNGTIYYQPADVAARRFRITTENCIAAQTQLRISRNLRDNAGWYLDGNNNGIAGEVGDARQSIASDDVLINF